MKRSTRPRVEAQRDGLVGHFLPLARTLARLRSAIERLRLAADPE